MATKEKAKEMPVVHEPPRHRWLERFQRRAGRDPFEEMDRMFDRLMGAPFGAWMRPARWEWPLAHGLAGELPRVDVIDRDKEVLVRAEVPGVSKDELEVTLSERMLTLRGTVKHEEEQEEGDYYYCETGRGEFTRTIALPAEVDGTKAKALYKDGIVELTIPKLETAKRQKIEIEG